MNSYYLSEYYQEHIQILLDRFIQKLGFPLNICTSIIYIETNDTQLR